MKFLQLQLLFAISLAYSAYAMEGPQTNQEDAREEIRSLLIAQVAAWNKEDIEAFMETYWNSEKLTFSGGGKTTRGWQSTLDKYKESYPKGSMGELHFDGLEIDLLSDSVALVLGNWHLNMFEQMQNPKVEIQKQLRSGNFSLVMRKINGSWKIVHDHSSTLDKEKDWITFEQSKNIALSHLHGRGKIEYMMEGHLFTAKSDGKEIVVDRKSGEIRKSR